MSLCSGEGKNKEGFVFHFFPPILFESAGISNETPSPLLRSLFKGMGGEQGERLAPARGFRLSPLNILQCHSCNCAPASFSPTIKRHLPITAPLTQGIFTLAKTGS